MFCTRTIEIILCLTVCAIRGQREHAILCDGNPTGLRLFTAPQTGCRRFALCQGSTYYGTLQCPGHSLFDEARQYCQHRWLVNCPEPIPEYPNCLNGVNPGNCSMFHLCYLGRQFDFTCNPPLVYSSTHLVCMYLRDLSPQDRSKCAVQ